MGPNLSKPLAASYQPAVKAPRGSGRAGWILSTSRGQLFSLEEVNGLSEGRLDPVPETPWHSWGLSTPCWFGASSDQVGETSRFLLKLLSLASRSHRLFCIKCLEAACEQNIQGVIELSQLCSYRGYSASGEIHLPFSLLLSFFFFLKVWDSWSSSYCCVPTPDFPSELVPISYLLSFIQYLYFLKSCTVKLGLKWIPKLTWTGKGIRQTTKSSDSWGSRPWHESYLKAGENRNFKSWFKPR